MVALPWAESFDLSGPQVKIRVEGKRWAEWTLWDASEWVYLTPHLFSLGRASLAWFPEVLTPSPWSWSRGSAHWVIAVTSVPWCVANSEWHSKWTRLSVLRIAFSGFLMLMLLWHIVLGLTSHFLLWLCNSGHGTQPQITWVERWIPDCTKQGSPCPYNSCSFCLHPWYHAWLQPVKSTLFNSPEMHWRDHMSLILPNKIFEISNL